jgi:hypothetical protein
MMQFYFLGSAQFMMNLGISGKAVPASMASAQVAQTIATYFALSFLLAKYGYQWTLTIGAACWLLMYVAYVLGKPKALVLAVQPLHGLAYVLFIIVGQIFAGAVGADAPSSMQALIFAATVGVGMFLGTQLAGFAMDKFSSEGKFLWRKIWMIPLVVVLAGTVVMASLAGCGRTELATKIANYYAQDGKTTSSVIILETIQTYPDLFRSPNDTGKMTLLKARITWANGQSVDKRLSVFVADSDGWTRVVEQ